MADQSDERRVRTVKALQGVATLLLRSYDEVRKSRDQYIADGGNPAFDAAFFTALSTQLGLTEPQFADLRTVILEFVTWAEESGPDRLGKLARARSVG